MLAMSRSKAHIGEAPVSRPPVDKPAACRGPPEPAAPLSRALTAFFTAKQFSQRNLHRLLKLAGRELTVGRPETLPHKCYFTHGHLYLLRGMEKPRGVGYDSCHFGGTRRGESRRRGSEWDASCLVYPPHL